MQQKWMNWSNLRVNKCPSCNDDLTNNAEIKKLSVDDDLLIHVCGFQIRMSKMRDIINKLQKKQQTP